VPPAPTPEPVASNTTAEGRASNRRVEISLQH
jgi:flagellar motor protein MotB